MGSGTICLKLALFSCMLIRLKKGQEGLLGIVRDVALFLNCPEIGIGREEGAWGEDCPAKKPCCIFLSPDSNNTTKCLERGEFGLCHM